MPSIEEPKKRRRIAMYLHAAGVVLLVLGFIGSVAMLGSGYMQAVAAVNAAGFACMIASYWLRRDRLSVAIFIFLGAVLVYMQAGLR